MLRIRKGAFETNSSSSDYYNDYDDSYPSISWDWQRIDVHFDIEDIKDTKDEKILLDEFQSIEDDIIDLFGDFYDEGDYEIEEIDEIMYIKNECHCSIEWSGGYYPETRYSPAEYPQPEVIEWIDGLNPKEDISNQINKCKQNILKIIKEHNLTMIKGVTKIVVHEPDEDKALENIY